MRAPLFGLVLLSACGEEPAAEPEAAELPPNVLVVTLDTTRRDAMGFMGRDPSPTPVLDLLARECVIFEDAFAPAPLTLPSHSSLMTGLSPHRHSVRDNSVFRLPAEAWTLAERLGEQGYSTAATVSAYVLDQDFGIDQGFQSYQAPPREPGSAHLYMAELPADQTVDRALAVLDELEGPFFLWVHLFDPHFPYEPKLKPRGQPSNALERSWALYEAEIRYADHQLGRLFARLRQDESWERTLIVFAADHGEWVGERGPEKTHGHYIYDPTMRVPLMVKAPGVAPRRIPGPVSLVDVTPTLLGLLGTPPEAGLDGRDLSAILRDGGALDLDSFVDLESYSLYLSHSCAPFEGLVDGRFKLIHSRGDQLIDRALPEFEGPRPRDVSAEHPEVLARMRAELERRFGEARSLPQSGIQADPAMLEKLGYTVGNRPRDGSRPQNTGSLRDGFAMRGLLRELDEVMGAMVEKDWARAVEMLEPLHEQHPESAHVAEQLGISRFSLALQFEGARRQELLVGAMEALQRALAVQFERVRSHYNVGLIHRHRAQHLFQRAAQLGDAAASEAVDVRAEALRSNEQALEHFEIAVQLEPTYPEALVNLSQLEQWQAERLVAEEDDEAALELYERAASRLRVFLDTVPRDHRDWPAFSERRREYEARIAELRDS